MVTAVGAVGDAAIQRQKMTYEAYLKLQGDSRQVEWVNGEVIIYMPPLYEHQMAGKE